MRISHKNINNMKIYIQGRLGTPKKTERKKEKIIKSIAIEAYSLFPSKTQPRDQIAKLTFRYRISN
jgi:hypothetical protein